MLDKKKVIENAENKYSNYLVHIQRSSKSSKLSGESQAIVEAIVEAINNGVDFEVEEKVDSENEE